MQKAQDAIFVEDLEPLIGKSPHELMPSHVHKLMQVYDLVLYLMLFVFFFFTLIF